MRRATPVNINIGRYDFQPRHINNNNLNIVNDQQPQQPAQQKMQQQAQQQIQPQQQAQQQLKSHVVILIALLHSPPFYASVNKDFICSLFKLHQFIYYLNYNNLIFNNNNNNNLKFK